MILSYPYITARAANKHSTMTEHIEKITTQDIDVTQLAKGETSIVFQRHGKYNRDPAADDAGSISRENAAELYEHNKEFFDRLVRQGDIYILFVSSDTQYAGKGHRSLETAQVAQDAATESLIEAGLDPGEHIINLNPAYSTARHEQTDQDIRPMVGLREPQIFNPDDVAYMQTLQEKYGYADEDAKAGLSPKAWAMHEMDTEVEARRQTNAEGEEDLIARTDMSLAVLERYARIWHAAHPGKRLIIWAASHYDTISPLIKRVDGTLRNADGTLSDAYQPVDYGGGISIRIPAQPEGDVSLERRAGKQAKVSFGKTATRHSVTRLHQPKY